METPMTVPIFPKNCTNGIRTVRIPAKTHQARGDTIAKSKAPVERTQEKVLG